MDLELAQKVVLVTGGSDGLGAALAGRLLEEGARVAICGRDADRLESTRAALAEISPEVLAVQVDVTQAADTGAFVAAAVERWGRIDGLVNNAGQSAGGSIEQVSDESWQADLDLKVVAASRLIRLALPHLRASGGGAIVNVLAIAAKAAGANSMPSAASRAAGLALTKALSKELGPDRVRVNAVLIGLVESGQWRRKADDRGIPVEDLYAADSKGIPLGRFGRGEEFGDLAAYLLSPRSSYVTGSAINLDGGLSAAI
ncbi:SDR family oxidoreductase [Kineosporia babensis]|uniref:SDR family oxidoreductase n=1 Tax=Kineosporia babensis TaxID=499548 RepID=A0A9X1NCY6_9ACTN|nr:SDR family oxidoreductase [Kineosporia babensis]MCD5310971.1 SDR family oxidoreductase [Kineosporia babensis]